MGTRGIPNYHGGFEQFAEYFSVYLANQGHDVYVYNSSMHPYQEKTFKGVHIIHCKDPENRIGTAGQFIYDVNSILDSRKRNFDILLQLGYTSSSVWYKLLPKKSMVITNMDGLEWKRSKYSKKIQSFLKVAESLAVKSSDHLISDSVGIQNYLNTKYNVQSKYIAYGADLFHNPNEKVLNDFEVKPYKYNMLVARFEPENNLETILDGVVLSNKKETFLVVGKHDSNAFGAYLKKKYQHHDFIKFVGGIYDIDILNNLRYYSNLYFHGHSVGGTNPSLLEAMSSNALIVGHKNEFNSSILGDFAFYFESDIDVKGIIESIEKKDYLEKVNGCRNEIVEKYNWNTINKQYLEFFKDCLK
ncbi:putative glycosyltransferase (GT4) [Formosa agariphila KMM 3901]|uniref:Putative glycosyltransferase (GT4) n=1 Tax=Formosa agariphila (strain DSM 15362 / KCTC 12365 / LMG 23005 / KMM 3901 / M-2Alg 35-1) TaxID=1347342 RepID=T2KR56_FORAG|nr:putative glycosyltransferase (GT4) [Formosa agariphila KMM 3901]